MGMAAMLRSFAQRRPLELWIAFTLFSWLLIWHWSRISVPSSLLKGHSTNAYDSLALGTGLDLMFQNPDFPAHQCPFTLSEIPPESCWNEGSLSKFQAWAASAEKDYHNRYDTLPIQHKPSVRPTSVFDVEVLVITGVNYHRKRADIVMATWGSVWPHIRFITDAAEPRLPIEQVMQTPADHSSSQEKWILAMKARFAPGLAAGRRWFLIVDDDGFVVPDNLIHLVREYDHNQVLLIGHNDWYHEIKRILGGAGWLISAGLAEKAIPHLPLCVDYKSTKHPEAVWSDVKTVECLHLHTGIVPVHRFEFNEQSPSGMTTLNIAANECVGASEPHCYKHAKPFGSGKAVTYHYVSPWQQQLQLWRLYLAFNQEYSHPQHRTSPDHNSGPRL